MLAFIDESGDEGTLGKGTRWLTFGAVMVADADARATRELAEEICKLTGRGQRQWIHFTDLTHEDRLGCLSRFSQATWVGTVVASDTTQYIDGSRLDDPTIQYRYPARYVVERISARAAELREKATIYFEARRNFNLVEFRTYMSRVMVQEPRRVDPRYIDPARIHVMAKGYNHTLAIADGLAYSAQKALEPSRVWGTYDRGYFDVILPKLWRGPIGSKNIHLWGLVLMPTSLWGGVFIKDYPWVRELV